ncbi:MAG: S1 RNA-binding domain-containing protein [Clostridiales bacterium]|jgi:small subunit ribosomal protein S1|nr:S1 RNA-binding domain-containing protein [Clostridiales bacterium]
MSTENTTNIEDKKEVVEVAKENEVIPSMDDFKDQIEKSFKKVVEGDILKGTVIGISDTEVTLDLGSYTEGIVKLEELSNDPAFSIKGDVTVGEEMSCIVINEDDGKGNILLSKKRADDILSWEKLSEDMETKTKLKVKIAQAVKGGLVTYLYGIRAFIPASQLSIEYVEDLETWVGKEIEIIVITASKDDRKLILSGKEVELEAVNKKRARNIANLTRGFVTTGTVEKIMPYGAFVNIGEGLSGLLHISQISEKRIKSPNEIIKEGETVTVKILDVKDGKISLSMKAVIEKEDVAMDFTDAPSSYQSGEEATTNLASLLKNIKLK